MQSARNLADNGSRSISARDLQGSEWIKGPDILSSVQDSKEEFHLVDADHDSNARSQVSTLKTVTNKPFGIERFLRFST